MFGSGWYEEGTPKSDAAAYTQAFVERAINLYDDLGLEGTLDYYNSPDSVDGQWYVFIGDENDMMIAHATVPDNVGKHYNEVISPDGYPAGAQVAAAAVEGGAWTSYIYLNPTTESVQTKHSWVTRHNGMIFGSGWYEEGVSKSDEAAYTQALVERAINLYDDLGLEGTLDYYNDAVSVDGQWYVYIIDADSKVSLANAARPEFVGAPPTHRIDPTGYDYGEALYSATEEGKWISYIILNPATDEQRRKHAWIVRHDDLFFGAGWYEDVQ